MLENSTAFDYLLPLVSAILLTLLLMPTVIRLAQKVGAVDQPNERKVHQISTPRMGGVAFLIALLLIPFTFLDISSESQGFLLGLIIIGATGIADDILEISPQVKFTGVILGSTVFLLMSGTSITNLGDLFGFGDIETGWLAIPITLLAMVGFVNALNLSDGLDGLAAGISLIATFFLASFAFSIGDQPGLMIAVVLFGAMIGFLYFNTHPAKVFMGDTGSLILGYTLAALSLMLLHSGEGRLISPISMGILLGLPLSDTIYVMLRRIRKGNSPFLPDKTHFHHRLIELGLSHAGAVAVFYGLIFLYGCVAVLFAESQQWLQSLVLLALILTTYLPLALLERIGFSFHIDEDGLLSDSKQGAYFNMATRWLGHSIPTVTLLIPVSLMLPIFTLTLSGDIAVFTASVVAMVVALYPWKDRHDVSWSHGLLYLTVFVLLLAVNSSSESWVQSYMFAVTALLACWVILKLCFKRHLRVFLTTGLESLLLIFSWLIPWLAGRFDLVSADSQHLLYVVCSQSIVFLIATKIVLRRQPRRNKPLLISLLLLAGITLI